MDAAGAAPLATTEGRLKRTRVPPPAAGSATMAPPWASTIFPIRGSSAQLGRVLQNLIANSLKFKSDAPPHASDRRARLAQRRRKGVQHVGDEHGHVALFSPRM